MKNKYTCTDYGGSGIEIEADSARDAAQEYVDGGDWGPIEKTEWVDVRVTPINPPPTVAQIMAAITSLGLDGTTEFGDHITISVAEDYDIDDIIGALPAGATAEWAGSSNTDIRITWGEYPDNDNSELITITLNPEEPTCVDGQDHDWASPYSVLGGIKENPGVWCNGGGVIIKTVCRHCGKYCITNTWAQRSDTGEQGLDSTRYEDADEASEAWVSRMDRAPQRI